MTHFILLYFLATFLTFGGFMYATRNNTRDENRGAPVVLALGTGVVWAVLVALWAVVA